MFNRELIIQNLNANLIGELFPETNCLDVFLKIDSLKNFARFTRKHPEPCAFGNLVGRTNFRCKYRKSCYPQMIHICIIANLMLRETMKHSV